MSLNTPLIPESEIKLLSVSQKVELAIFCAELTVNKFRENGNSTVVCELIDASKSMWLMVPNESKEKSGVVILTFLSSLASNLLCDVIEGNIADTELNELSDLIDDVWFYLDREEKVDRKIHNKIYEIKSR